MFTVEQHMWSVIVFSSNKKAGPPVCDVGSSSLYDGLICVWLWQACRASKAGKHECEHDVIAAGTPASLTLDMCEVSEGILT
jgi:hypothetical protein